MQGLMAALKERKGLVRSYLTRCEVRDAKFQKLSKCSDAGQRFEMEHELEALKKDISDIKTRVKTSNDNLLKELSLLDASLAPDLHRLIQSYSRASLASSSRLEELHADGVSKLDGLLLGEEEQRQRMRSSSFLRKSTLDASQFGSSFERSRKLSK